MSLIYGLAVALLIFEGIIIQCEETEDERPRKRLRVDPSPSPYESTEYILNGTDYERIANAIISPIAVEVDPLMTRILQKDIILIRPSFNGEIRERHHFGNLFLLLSSYEQLFQFFEKYGNKVKRIELWYHDILAERRKEIHEKVIKRCANNLEELRIYTENDALIWKDLSIEGKDIVFPEVTKFQLEGGSNKKHFNLHSIFPKLEFLKLRGIVADGNCLDYVTGLKKLTLDTQHIKEAKFPRIFRNNVNMEELFLFGPTKPKTMQLIATHLTKLKTLIIRYPGEMFLSGSPNSIEIPSVKHFDITFEEVAETKKLSFYMPALEKLTANGDRTDARIIDFIKHSKNLKTLELIAKEYNTLETIGKLKHIKEFTTSLPKLETNSLNLNPELEFNFLREMFDRIDETFELQTLKFMDSDDESYEKYKSAMEKINHNFGALGKLTWTISNGHQIETGMDYIRFSRDP